MILPQGYNPLYLGSILGHLNLGSELTFYITFGGYLNTLNLRVQFGSNLGGYLKWGLETPKFGQKTTFWTFWGPE